MATVGVKRLIFSCVTSHVGFNQCQEVFDKLSVANCDATQATAVNLRQCSGMV